MIRKKCCFDRIPFADGRTTPSSRGLAPVNTLWDNGQILRVYFMEGTSEQKEFVKATAVKWSEFANIHFEFTDNPEAEIRITFDETDGAWSAVGKDALLGPKNRPTMNLGWVDEAVVLHEFGHAIGLGHEHQNPVGGIQWNKELVYRELAGPPNYWTPAIVDSNLFDKYKEDQIMATALDPASIMMYPIPEQWTSNNFSTDFNPTFSPMDKIFIASIYPYEEIPPTPTPEPEVTEPKIQQLAVSVFTLYEGAITEAGTTQTYSFEVKESGSHVIETTGETDLYLTLLGPNDPERKIKEDDDSGLRRNSKITAMLVPGTYYLQIKHYNQETGVGEFGISIITARSGRLSEGNLVIG